METVQGIPVGVYKKQLTFLKSKSFTRGFVGGRGCGKSYVGAYDLIKRAKKGRHYMVIAPTHSVLRDASFRSLTEVATVMQRLKVVTRNPDLAMKIYTGDGGTAEVITRSGERPDLLKGPNLSGVWIDEAGEQKKEVYLFVLPTLREKGELGWASMTFTPKGKHHWTYETFYDGYNRPKRDTKLIRARTSENPFLPDKFYDLVASQYSERMKLQELEGEFIDFEGLLFHHDWFQVVSPQDFNKKNIVEWVRYWDKAGTAEVEGGKKTNSAYSVGVLMGRTKDNVFYIPDIVRGRWAAMDREQKIKETAVSDYDKYGQIQIWTEQEPGSGGKESAQATIRMLAGYNVRADKITGDKITRGQPFIAQSEAGNIKLVDNSCQGSTNEMNDPWHKIWLDEICAVPEGKYMDQYDASVGAFNKLAIKKGPAKLHRRMLGEGDVQEDLDELVPVSAIDEFNSRILEQNRMEDLGSDWLRRN